MPPLYSCVLYDRPSRRSGSNRGATRTSRRRSRTTGPLHPSRRAPASRPQGSANRSTDTRHRAERCRPAKGCAGRERARRQQVDFAGERNVGEDRRGDARRRIHRASEQRAGRRLAPRHRQRQRRWRHPSGCCAAGGGCARRPRCADGRSLSFASGTSICGRSNPAAMIGRDVSVSCRSASAVSRRRLSSRRSCRR